ncbi:MAG TPA: outer membrane beta-barrel protein [Usitatibacter sp.]|nr:outer membrane beta-barrel protein [Usitatibacter sp.]
MEPSKSGLFAAVALLAAFTPPSSWALFGDRVELWAAENATHDSNVLRLSKDAELPVGVPQRGDTIDTTYLGGTLDARFSEQQVTAAYTWYRSRYHAFTDLDHDGHDANANWRWVAGPVLKGTLGFTDDAGLASFADIQAAEPDYVTTRSGFATANYMVTPRYRLSAAFTQTDARHGSEARKVDDINIASSELGLSYVTPLENSLGAIMRVENGHPPDGTDITALPFDTTYRQYGVGATVAWTFASHSTLDGRVEFVRRQYDQETQRNYSGPILRGVYTWKPTDRFLVATSLSRDVGPTDDIQTSFVLVTGGYIRPRWSVTEKVTLQADAEYNVWDYRGDPLLVQDMTNRVRTFGGSLEWRPYKKVLLRLGVNHEVRTSNVLLADYEVTVAFIEGRIGF